MSDTQQEQSQCIACQQKIASTAKRCHKCSSFQNWLRYLQSSTYVLSPVVALISVLGLVVPLLVKTFKQETSAVKVSFRSAKIECKPKAISGDEVSVDSYSIKVRLLLTNTGKKSGFLEAATINLGETQKPIAKAILIISPSNAVVKPDTFALIDLDGKLQILKDEALPLKLSKTPPPVLEVQAAWLIVKSIQYDLKEKQDKILLPTSKLEIEFLEFW